MAPTRTRVLIADDEVPILRATSALLEDMDFDVVRHSDGATIAQAVAREKPAVLLQDIRMPGLDVRRLVATLRGDPQTSRVRIVLFSAGMELEQLATELEVAHVQKPFKPDALVRALTA